ncbi:TetR/AcrR family transcriptional regulator [Rhodococcoides yunnanense]|uniref:TetR/AcrR family transcriptional regulator n=1 Tax=Rhodococcoides yunnanense TaxID=278209 RepID=UPI000934EED8|nr:TetR/AcrR family transcriptional regulator [Rhodococcus yunnanensis]
MSEADQPGVEPSAPDRRALRRAAKIATIVSEAWALSRADGLAGISLRDLAERVDLRQPSLYAYFDSKLALYDAMFADGNRQLLAYTADLTPTGNPELDLTEFVGRVVRFSSDDVERHQLLFQRTIPGFEPSPESYAIAIEFLNRGAALLQAAGVDRAEDVDLFTAMCAGLTHQQVANDPGGDRWVAQARRVVTMFLTEVRQQPRE